MTSTTTTTTNINTTANAALSASGAGFVVGDRVDARAPYSGGVVTEVFYDDDTATLFVTLDDGADTAPVSCLRRAR